MALLSRRRITAQVSDVCILIPVINPETITAHEPFQALVWHPLVSTPSSRPPREMGIRCLPHRAVSGLNHAFPLLRLFVA